MIAIGQRLGPFEVLGPLGAGGMGEVYRARDTRLGRDVAIKVLPDLFAHDPDRMARFERESQLLASINHPHIASVYGVEEAAGARALVMELVDGPTLADRIAEGAIPLDEALAIARQIADALEAAHERGIIHRDLKPANIKLTSAGQVKVLDFGLAKAVEPTAGSGDLAHSPTMSVGTQAGLILGTAAYMSPEQARGRLSDRRTDVWAFGCVLFEMLAGRQAFGGESVTDLIAAIVKEDPDWSALPPEVPPSLLALLRRCVRKDARQRLRDIGDARLEIEDLMANPPQRAGTALRGSVDRRPLMALAALVVLLAVTAAWLAWTTTRPVAAPTVVKFAVGTPAGITVGPASWPAVALSPDGSRLVMTAATASDDTTALYSRPFNSPDVTRIAGTEKALNPFFSPDGRWVAFTVQSENSLKKVPIEGGKSTTICGGTEWGGGTWNADDTIVFTPNYTSGLWKVKGTGGAPEKLTEPDAAQGELGHWWPQFLPDGRHVVYTSFSTPIERSKIVVYSLDSGEKREVVQGAMFGRYAASGHLIYLRKDSVAAAPFDAVARQVTGDERPVLDNVSTYFTNGGGQIAVSDDGTLAYVTADALNANAEMVWVDRSGKLTPAIKEKRRFSDHQFSRDGRRLAVTIDDGQRDIWTYDFDRAVFGRVTSSPVSEFSPVWLPDGRSLVYAGETPIFHIFRKPPIGSAPDEPVVTGKFDAIPMAFSPDGRFIIYSEADPQTRTDLWIKQLDGERKARKLIASRFSEEIATLSRDGKWIAYTSDESGHVQLYVQAFPDATERWPVTNEPSGSPRWNPNGSELFYVTANPQRLMVVPVRAGAEFTMGKPSVVFEGQFNSYDVAPDGRVLISRRDPAAPQPTVQVVVNWFEELRRKF